MAILEKEILVGLKGGNLTYFENIGYEIPRSKNKYGKLTVPVGTKLLVKVEDLSKSSRVELTKICDECGEHILRQRYDSISALRKNGDGKDRCNKCGQLNGSNNRLNNIKYENTLECHADLDNKHYLLEEFSDKNEKRPNEISYGTEKDYLWECPKCSNEYEMNVTSRFRGNNCPYCTGQKILLGYNDLWTKHPEVAKFLVNPNRGYEIITGANLKELFKCSTCGFEQSRRVADVIRYGFSCACNDKIHFPEKFMMGFLNQIGVKYKTQKTFDWSNNKRYDFYIEEDYNLIIETHGGQHYHGNFITVGGKNLAEEQENDLLKKNLAINNNLNYIVIDCRYSDCEYIKGNIVSSEISKFFKLENVNWIKVSEYALNSLIKKACDLWNKGIRSTVEIGKILNLSSNTISLYLKQGYNLTWCDYNAREVMRRNGSIQGNKNNKKIIQLTKSGQFIKEWGGISEAQRDLNISNLSIACSGKLKTAGGFRWMYKSEYTKLIKIQEVVQ